MKICEKKNVRWGLVNNYKLVLFIASTRAKAEGVKVHKRMQKEISIGVASRRWNFLVTHVTCP